jgi:phosphotransacetylase
MPAPRDFAEVVRAAAQAAPCSYVVAGGEDESVVEAIELCRAQGIEGFTLVGDLQQIAWLLATRVLDDDVRIEPSADAVRDALRLCAARPNPVLVKGHCDSATLLGGVLAALPREARPFLSHVTLIPHPSAHKLLALSDAGLNVAPDLRQKAAILQNGLGLLAALGVEQPRVLLAAGMEDRGQPLPAIADARELKRLHDGGRWPEAVVDGPFGLDIGLAPGAVAAKGLGATLGGLADLVVMPNIEAGNFAAKMYGILHGPPWAGLVVGGPYPIVVGSRSDPPESRVASLALARLVAGKLPPGRLPELPAAREGSAPAGGA